MDIDSGLVEKAQSGNQKAFGMLVKKYRDPILHLAFAYVNNYEDARDIAQNIFIKASHKITTFEGRSSFASWLYRIAINTCLDAKRMANRQSNHMPLSSVDKNELSYRSDTSANNPLYDLESSEINKQILSALARLSERQQAIVQLRYFQGLSTREIAETLECDVNTIRTHLFRAFGHLRKILYDLKME